jgi:hypothetical protein
MNRNKLLSAAVAAAFCITSLSVLAMDDMDMKKMDANGDGMVSKDEWTKYHEAMWAKMKKGKNGMVDMNDMGMMQGGMANDGKMKDDKITKDDDKMMQGGMNGNDKMKGK